MELRLAWRWSVGWLPIGPGDYLPPVRTEWFALQGGQSLSTATNVTNINRGFGGVAPLYGGVRFSNVWLAANDVQIRRAISTLPAKHFGTGHSAPTVLNPKAFRNSLMMTGKPPIVPTRKLFRRRIASASPSS